MTITLHWSLIPVLFFMWCILSNTPRTAIRNYCDNHSQHQDSLLPLCSLLTQYSPHFPTTTSSTLASSCHHDRAWAHSKTKPVKCPTRVPARNIGPEFDPERDQEYVKLAINRLQGAVRIPTESYDDMGHPDQDSRFEIMAKLHEYLEKTFPKVHDKLKLEKVATYGLLYTWQGSQPSLKPVVLMAHQDVVPVNPATVDQWTHKPYDAHMDKQGWIWGRGVADCKNSLIGILSALEKLVEEDFEPTRSIILSFGFDEEVSGRRSAQPLANTILDRYGPDGVALIVDEGFSGIDSAYGQLFARMGTAEKGAVSIKLEVLTPGGHSSVPPPHTGIGILSALLVALEHAASTTHKPDGFGAPLLREGNPMLSYLACAAEHAPEISKELKNRILDPREWTKSGQDLARVSPFDRAFLSTTQAVDLVQGGVKINALPEYATASVNYRIDFLSSVNATLTAIEHILRPIVHRANLTFEAYPDHDHSSSSVPDSISTSSVQSLVRLSVVPQSAIEPAPLSPAHGAAWDLMSGTIRHVWPEAVVAPSGMVANTDTKWYWNVTRNIFRFVPSKLDLIKDFHTVNERIHKDAHLSLIKWYYKLVRNTEGWDAE